MTLPMKKNWSNQQSPTGSEVDLISFDYFQKIVYLLFSFFKKKVSHQGRSSVRTFHLEIAGLSFELFRLFTHHSVAL